MINLFDKSLVNYSLEKLSRSFKLLSNTVSALFERTVLAQLVLDVPHLNVIYIIVH